MNTKQYAMFLDALSSCPAKLTDDPEVNFYVDKHLNREFEEEDDLPEKFEDLSKEDQETYLAEALMA